MVLAFYRDKFCLSGNHGNKNRLSERSPVFENKTMNSERISPPLERGEESLVLAFYRDKRGGCLFAQ